MAQDWVPPTNPINKKWEPPTPPIQPAAAAPPPPVPSIGPSPESTPHIGADPNAAAQELGIPSNLQLVPNIPYDEIEKPKPDVAKTFSQQVKDWWDYINTPIAKPANPTVMQQAASGFAQQHPYLGWIGNTAYGTAAGMTSPLSLGLTATTGVGGLAERLGYEAIANALRVPAQAAAAGMIGHGLYGVHSGKDIPTKLSGGLEAVLGGFGLRSLSPEGAAAIHAATPELSGIGTMTGERVRDLLGMEPKDAIAQKLITQEPNGQYRYIGSPGFIAPGVNTTTPDLKGAGIKIEEPEKVADELKDVTKDNIKASAAGAVATPDVGDEQNIRINPQNGQQFAGDAATKVEPPAPPRTPGGGGPTGPPPPPTSSSGNPGTVPPSSTAATGGVAPLDKLITALKLPEVRQAHEDWAANLTSERAQRIARSEAVTARGEEGARQRIAALAGDYGDKPMFTPPRDNLLNQAEVDILNNQVADSGRISGFERPRADVALGKLLKGQIIQDNEAELLARVFGNNFKDALLANRMLSRKPIGFLQNTVDFTKSMVTAGHFSAPFRQGAMLLHRGEFWGAFDDMFKAFGSEAASKGIENGIHALPHYELGQRAGLEFTNLEDVPNFREEAIRSKWAENLPLYGRFVRAGNRSYNAFLNTIRANVFESMVTDAANAAKLITDPKLRAAANPETNLPLAKSIANYVNAASGRGDLGRFEKYSKELNLVLFSPRLQAARLNMIQMLLARDTPYLVRKEAMKSFMSLAALGLTTAGIAKLGGAEISSDPTNADFAKPRIGNTRIDPWQGYQQYGVLAARALMGLRTSSVSNKSTSLTQGYNAPTYGGLLMDFARNKMNPAAGFATDLIRTHEIKRGVQSFQLGPELADTLVPILVKNMYDVYQNDPQLVLPLMAPNAFGIGVESYGSQR